jgi:hypothetical protein
MNKKVYLAASGGQNHLFPVNGSQDETGKALDAMSVRLDRVEQRR